MGRERGGGERRGNHVDKNVVGCKGLKEHGGLTAMVSVNHATSEHELSPTRILKQKDTIPPYSHGQKRIFELVDSLVEIFIHTTDRKLDPNLPLSEHPIDTAAALSFTV